MALFEFFLGLMLGIGVWLWERNRLQRQMRHLVRSLDDAAGVSLPPIRLLRREITRQQQQCQQLQAELQTSEYLLQVAPVGYLQVDEENQLLWCNQQAQQLLCAQRWEPGQVRLLLELVRSYELDHLIEQTRDCQQPQIDEWMFHPAYLDAAPIPQAALTLRAIAIPLTDGQVGVFLENRQPFVELRQSRDRAISDLAHELKTPLTSIRLVVETLLLQLQPPLRRWLERLLPEVDRLISLVQTWLELCQLEDRPNVKLQLQPVELRSLIASVWQTLEPIAQRQQLHLTYTEPETIILSADQSLLYRVFLNLLDNSIKYSPPQGTIRIEVDLIKPEATTINVIDSGCGFNNSDLAYVFDRLYRGDTSRTRAKTNSETLTTPASTGSGLGLAIVRQIILAHNGTIKAMNHPETGGAWIQIELPNLIADFRK